MPTYDYVCDHCGHRFEEMQSFKDEPLKTCPQCHTDALRRLFGTGAAILFKGSGFYETDYRSESYKKAAQADSENSKSADTKSDSSKSESKAATTNGASQASGKAASTSATATATN
ncbi:MAG: zinc ribbon domain-containing protein [Gemmataceae bacterium]